MGKFLLPPSQWCQENKKCDPFTRFQQGAQPMYAQLGLCGHWCWWCSSQLLHLRCMWEDSQRKEVASVRSASRSAYNRYEHYMLLQS